MTVSISPDASRVPGFVRAALALGRGWVWLYTGHLPAQLRHARRAEIESDMWEQQRAANLAGRRQAVTGADILGRVLCGVPDDLAWSATETAAALHHGRAIAGRIGTMTISVQQIRWMGFGAVLGGAIWIGLSVLTVGFDGGLHGGMAGLFILASGRETPAAIMLISIFGMAILYLCLMLGAVGVYTQQRAHIRKVGLIGFRILLAGISSLLIADALMVPLSDIYRDQGEVITTVGLSWTFFYYVGALLLTPVGLLLFGIGLPSPSRRVAFVLLGWLVASEAMSWTYLRLGSALEIVSVVLPGLCFALLGYSILSRSRAASRLET